MLDASELTRYSRHLSLPEVGMAGQEKLRAAKVLIVGAGGLGCPSALYLAAAGVGTLGLVEFDKVDLSNLQRQILYSSNDLNQPKGEVAQKKLSALNPQIEIKHHAEKLSSTNARELISAYDLILDGTDNFTTRYLINDACVLLKKTNVFGSVFRFEGQVTIFAARTAITQGPCYRCLYPTPPPAGAVPDCAAGGVFGVIPGLIGILQATEAIKLILGIGDPLIGRMLLVDTLAPVFRELKIKRNPACPVCGEAPTITELRDEPEVCAASASEVPLVTSAELRAKLAAHESLTLIDVREPHETATGTIPNAREIPLAQLQSEIASIPRTTPVVVYCQGGSRSARGAKTLLDAGFTDVTSLTGGMRAWQAE